MGDTNKVYDLVKVVYSEKTKQDLIRASYQGGEEMWIPCGNAVHKFLSDKIGKKFKVTELSDKGIVTKVQIVDVGNGEAGDSGYVKGPRVQQIKIIGGLQKADVEREANEFYKTHKVFATNPMMVAIDEGIMLVLVIYYEI